MELNERRRVALDEILLRLNPRQLKAVMADIHRPLQIIAGPGTGKTAVLTARVLYLLLQHSQQPHHIIVTTFTKKAANEMTDRLGKLIPEGLGIDLSKLIIGTFHSICVRILKQNGYHIGLSQQFKVADERDAKEILQRLLSHPSKELKDLKLYMEELRKINQQGDFDLNLFQENKDKSQGYDLDKIRRLISTLKSTCVEHTEYASSASKSNELSQIYKEYQDSLFKSNYVDFDDILMHTRKLLKLKICLPYVNHVLVDEFQDTNKTQLELLYLFSSQSENYKDNVTIVGDPDQSIYAFRNAVSLNFEYMRNHYDNKVDVVFLNQNYRSTRAVLDVSESLMKQEKETSRQLKDLVSNFEHDFNIINNRFETNKDEADFILNEIKTLCRLPSLFQRDDFAILLRSRFHSRVIELSLRKYGIAYKVLQGKLFWDLKEVQTIIDYLRCVASETDKLPLMRVINVPSRGIGPKALDQIRLLIDTVRDPNDSILNFLEDLPKSNSHGLNNSTIKGIKSFTAMVQNAKSLLQDGTDIGDGINKMFDFIVQETNLIEKTRPEDPMTTENNIKEFKREILEFEIRDNSLPIMETGELVDAPMETVSPFTFLADFIESIDLYEKEPEEKELELKKPKVVISTIHGAKGLEWPVVFVPSLTESYFPASWALRPDEAHQSGNNSAKKALKNAETAAALLNEERRALYVAMTRAKTSLYLNGFKKKIFGGGDEELEESRFLKNLTADCKDRNQGLLNYKMLEKFYLINLKQVPVDKKLLLKTVLSEYNDYHDNSKAETSSLKTHFLKSQPVPKGGGFITSAASVLGSSTNKVSSAWKKQGTKRKAVSLLAKSSPLTSRSFAPTYKYSRDSFSK